jgi:hypothetical protein
MARRRVREAMLIQLALTAILVGVGILLLAVGDMYMERRYNGEPDRTTPHFCWIDQAPEPFLPTCAAE